MRVGIGYRKAISDWIHSCPNEIQILEVVAEHFFEPIKYDSGLLQGKVDKRRERLLALKDRMPFLMHGLGLSLGTPGPIDQTILKQFCQVSHSLDPLWVSDHIAFTRAEAINLGHLNPIAFDPVQLNLMVSHAKEVMDACGKQLLLENICSHIRPCGELSEPDFINTLCEDSGCGLLLDITNLFVNSRNHDYDPLEWLCQIEAKFIKQFHIVGYSVEDDRWHDHHAEAIQSELWPLAQAAVRYASADAIVLERDTNFPGNEALEIELKKIELMCRESKRDE